METLQLSMEDLEQHVVKFGFDIFPPIEISSDRTRLNLFYEEVRERFGELYDQLLASDTEFKISKRFRKDAGIEGRSLGVETFVLTQRGPVFIFPLLLPEPVLATGLEDNYLEKFQQLQELFFSLLPGRKRMRVGLIRELIFATGDTPCHSMLTDRSTFAGGEIRGGNALFAYRDAKCNVRINFSLVEATKQTQLLVGTTVSEPAGYGLLVSLDVNNTDIRPLEDADIEDVLTRATSLWPDELLRYLNERSQS